jgi:hypothetical protein
LFDLNVTVTNFVSGRSVTALGVLFDFMLNSANTTVQPVADMIKENWVHISQSQFPPGSHLS